MEVGPDERGAEPTLIQETSETTPTESLSDPLTSQALAAIEDEAELNKLVTYWLSDCSNLLCLCDLLKQFI